MNSLPSEVEVYRRAIAVAGRYVVLNVNTGFAVAAAEREFTDAEASRLAAALVIHSCDAVTARAVCGLLGGDA